MINKITIILLFSTIGIGCSAQKHKYIVEEIYDDKCVESYFRLKLKSINNDSIFQVLSFKDSSSIIEINPGDTVLLKLKEIDIEKQREIYYITRPPSSLYCDGNLILKKEECFYESKNLKGLRVIE